MKRKNILILLLAFLLVSVSVFVISKTSSSDRAFLGQNIEAVAFADAYHLKPCIMEMPDLSTDLPVEDQFCHPATSWSWLWSCESRIGYKSNWNQQCVDDK